jgi:hypothetical protein
MTAGLLLAFLGYLLVYAGVKGVHPWGPIVEAFGGKAPPPPGSSNVPASSLATVPSVGGTAQAPGTTTAAGRGSTGGGWAVGILAAGGWPLTPSNVAGLNAWIACEGGTGHNNPMNTTQSGPGATGDFNSVGVKIFDTPTNGVLATVATIRNGHYPYIIRALAQGKLGSALRRDAQVAANIGTWGTSISCIRGAL